MVQVMIVDDSAVMVNEVSSLLKKNDIDVLIASNGQEGFELLQNNSKIPLALVDINMPILDGLGMIAKVREKIPDCKTQFIMLTTEFDRKAKDRGKALLVKGWIIKPFKNDATISAIKKLLKNA